MLFSEKLEKSSVIAEPFPHLVVEDVLDAETLGKVTRSIPKLDKLTKGAKYGNNERFNYCSSDILSDPEIDEVFKQLTSTHLSQAFLDEIVRLFGEYIPHYFPDFEKRFGEINKLKAGIRGDENDNKNVDVLLDFQLASNTPVFLPGTTVRAPHIDCPKKLFVGLLYLRSKDDDSTGGDLELYTPKSDNLEMDITRTARKADMEVFKTVPYKNNTLVLLLNTPRSFHGVSVRSKTKHVRLFFNLLGEMKEPIFSLKDPGEAQKNTLDGALAGFGSWKFRR